MVYRKSHINDNPKDRLAKVENQQHCRHWKTKTETENIEIPSRSGHKDFLGVFYVITPLIRVYEVVIKEYGRKPPMTITT